MKNLFLILPIIFLTFSCNSQKKNDDTFKFEYLKVSNNKIKDSAKLKLKLYFNEYDIYTVNEYLKDSVAFNELKNSPTKSFLMNFENYSNYVPNRMKRKNAKDKYGYSNYVLDSTFYENFKTENLIFVAEEFYDKIDNLRLTQLEYNDNINSIIEVKYDMDRPIQFYGNTVKFNMYFSNASSKNIESFKGTIFVNNDDLDNLLNVEINSDVLPKNSIPNPLKKSELENWDIRIINTYYSDINDLRLEVSDFTKSTLQRNFKKLNIIFIPKEIIFEDGTKIYQ
jgi:hypothetical protein